MTTNRLQQGRARREQYQRIIDASERPDFAESERRARLVRAENVRRTRKAAGL